MRLILITFLCGLWLAALGGCERGSGTEPEDARPLVVVTTTMLTDLSAQIGGDAVQVEGIMRPGGDPHLYQPTPRDARMISRSQLVVTSGLLLEGWIDDLIANAGGARPVIVASEGVQPVQMEGFAGGVDPHFWFDLKSWQIAAKNVGAGLITLLGEGSEEAKAVQARLDAYLSQVEQVHEWVQQNLDSIPEEQRVLATSHDAFNYFGRAYDIEVVGVQGISTEQQASQRDLANMIEMVKARRLPAVFIETSVNPALIQQVARESKIDTAGPLYSDSIGAQDSPAGTFLGTVVENIRMITEALGGEFKPIDLDTI